MLKLIVSFDIPGLADGVYRVRAKGFLAAGALPRAAAFAQSTAKSGRYALSEPRSGAAENSERTGAGDFYQRSYPFFPERSRGLRGV